MNKIQLYIKEAYNELIYKVTWPSWEELQQSTVVVMIASLLIALIVVVMDQASSNVLKFIYNAIV